MQVEEKKTTLFYVPTFREGCHEILKALLYSHFEIEFICTF